MITRKDKVLEIFINRVKKNLDVIFDFSLSDKEFKESYEATKKEIRDVI